MVTVALSTPAQHPVVSIVNSSGEVISPISADRFQFVTKTADQTVNNSTVFQNDSSLVLTAAANTTWVVQGFIIYNSSVTADLKIAFSRPTGATFNWTPNGLRNNSTSATGDILLPAREGDAVGATVGGAGEDSVCSPCGLLTVGATAGSLRFTWAQGTAEVSNTIVKAGSYLTARRVV